MKILIDGENFRQGLLRVLMSGRLIKSNEQLKSFPIEELLRDVLARDDIDVKYFASHIKLPRGYNPDPRTIKIADEIKEEARVLDGEPEKSRH